MNKEDGGFIALSAFLAAAGGLLGFGLTGTIKGACLGAGIGGIAPIAVLCLGALL